MPATDFHHHRIIPTLSPTDFLLHKEAEKKKKNEMLSGGMTNYIDPHPVTIQWSHNMPPNDEKKIIIIWNVQHYKK